MNKSELIANNVFANNFNHTLHAYIDIAGGLVEGTLLGQIMYWFSPDKNGTIRAQIKKDDEYWIARKRSDWWDEIRISEKQYDRAVKNLLDKNLIVVARYKFGGIPTTHLRPNYEEICKQLDEYLYTISSKENAQISEQNVSDEKMELPQKVNPNLPKGKNGTSPKGKLEVTERVTSITEITNREYTENNNNNIYATETCAQAPQTLNEMFERFWQAYPKRKDKKRAYKVFLKIKPNDELLEKMLSCVEQEKQSLDWLKDNGQYIPYPSSWLSGERWNDENATDSTVTIIQSKSPKTVIPVNKNVALDSLKRKIADDNCRPSVNVPDLATAMNSMWSDDDDF